MLADVICGELDELNGDPTGLPVAELQLVAGDGFPLFTDVLLLIDALSCFGLVFLGVTVGGVSVPLLLPVLTCCLHLALLFLNQTYQKIK